MRYSMGDAGGPCCGRVCYDCLLGVRKKVTKSKNAHTRDMNEDLRLYFEERSEMKPSEANRRPSHVSDPSDAKRKTKRQRRPGANPKAKPGRARANALGRAEVRAGRDGQREGGGHTKPSRREQVCNHVIG